MHRETAHTARRSRSLVVLLLALAIVTVFGIAAQQALAKSDGSYNHGGASCSSCHTGGFSAATASSAKCITCHTGYVVINATKKCWTCHTPGQNMAPIKTGVPASCTATCHLANGTTHQHNPHPTRGTCTTCHNVTTSYNNANGSPHHKAQAPAAPKVTSFTPASGPVGTSVTLTGTGFTGATKVAFHGAAATTFSVSSAIKITATVPSGATSGTIAVTTASGTGTSATSFTVTAPPFTPTLTLKLSGLTSGAIKLGQRVTAKGKVTPTSLAGSKVTLTVQKKNGARWVKVKRVARTISATGTYSWKYKPLKRGAYRMRATIAKTAAHTAAKTVWRKFKVK